MKRIKKVGLVLVMVLAVTLVAGCESKKSSNAYEDTMKEYATTYYNEHMIGQEADVVTVSIQNLQDFNDLTTDEDYNDEGKSTYDLSKLSKCSADSSVDLVINAETKNIDNYEFHLNCN